MDEYNTGMDPEVKQYFRKIVKSFTAGLVWMIAVSTSGIFFRLGYVRDGARWYNIVFYIFSLVSLFMMLRYLYNLWKEDAA